MKRILFSDAKRFMAYIIRRSYAFQFLNFAILICLCLYCYNSHNLEMQRMDKIEKKIDFRYFNLTNSLQDIHHVRIDTLHGEVKDKLTPQ